MLSFPPFFSRRLSLRFGLAALALAGTVLLSCQSVRTEETPQGTQTYTAAISSFDSESKYPQSAKWRQGADSGTATLQGIASASMVFTSPPTDTVWLDLYRGGIRIMEVAYRYKGSTTLEYTKVYRQDLAAIELFKKIMPSSSAASFDSAFAKGLVDGDPLVKAIGFPAKKPVGLDTAAVWLQAMKLLLAKQQPLADLASTWALGIDSQEVHVRIKILVELKLIASDTLTLFPPPLVRVVFPLHLDSVLIAGGASKPVTGVFAATNQLSGSSVRIYRDTSDQTRGFDFDAISTIDRSQRFDLSGKLNLSAKATTTPGTYRLVVLFQDDALNQASSSVNFRVAPAPDRQGPSITFVSPPSDTVRAFADDSVDIKVLATDSSGVDSVWIDGRPAKLDNGFWVVKKIYVPVSSVGYEIKVDAVDRAGNRTPASVRVGRLTAPVAGEPFKQILQPLPGQKFLFDSASILVRWKLYDPRASLDSVVFEGIRAVKESDSIWSGRVPLAVVGTASNLVLVGYNSKGGKVEDFVKVTRLLDAKGPSMVIVSPTRDAVVEYAIAGLAVHLKVVDLSGIDSVKIGGVKVESVSEEYVRTVNLTAGARNDLVLSAWDKVGNRSDDTLHLTRKSQPTDSTPILKRIWPAAATGTIVPFETTTAILKWLVTDAGGISDTGVRIAGKLALRNLDTFSLEVPLVAGRTQSFRIDVINKKQMVAFDAAELTRGTDTQLPSATPVAASRTLGFDSTQAMASWQISDNGTLASVAINGTTVIGANGLYSAKLNLDIGPNQAFLVATDAANNIRLDTIVIRRTFKDTSKPVVLRDKVGPNFGSDSTSAYVSWKVTDNARLEVTINGVTITGVSGIYGTRVALTSTSTGVKLVASDSSGNTSQDTVTLLRQEPPVKLAWSGVKDMNTAEDSTLTTTFVLSGIKGNSVKILVLSSDTSIIPNQSLTPSTTAATYPFALQLAPKANANGIVTIKLQAREASDSAFSQFQLQVLARNDAPSFTISKTVPALNGTATTATSGWTTGMLAGPKDELSQKLRFEVQALDLTDLLGALPAIDSTGTLRVQAKPGVSGSSRFQVRLVDNSDSLGGHLNKSAWQAFTISVNAPPSMTLPVTTYSMYQNLGASPGSIVLQDDETSLGNLVLKRSSSNAGLLPADSVYLSGTGANRKVTFRPVVGRAGKATITFTVSDTAGGSFSDSIVVEVKAMNHAPSFLLSSSSLQLQNYNRDSLLVKLVTAEATNDSQQYIVSRRVDLIGAAMDSVLSAKAIVDGQGTLHLPRLPNPRGWFTFRITIKDNGGTENGAIDSAFKDVRIFFSDTIIDAADGNAYRYLQLGNRTWFAEDLRRAHPYGISNPPEYYQGSFGKRYSWAMAMNLDSAACDGSVNCAEKLAWQQQGLCPTGWNIPDSTEWMLLLKWAAAGQSDSLGIERLKSRADWTNTYGMGNIFTANGIDTWGMNLKPSYPTNTNILLGRYWAKVAYSGDQSDHLDRKFADFSTGGHWVGAGTYNGIDNKLSVWGIQYVRYGYGEVFPIRCIKTLPPGQWQ